MIQLRADKGTIAAVDNVHWDLCMLDSNKGKDYPPISRYNIVYSERLRTDAGLFYPASIEAHLSSKVVIDSDGSVRLSGIVAHYPWG